jgi:FKBP-type peptidyl-prolyl cis-trans isomerase 2
MIGLANINQQEKNKLMQRVQNGDHVILEYEGTLNDGEIVDSSANSRSLEFEVGAGKVMPGFDTGVLGMAVGETKSVTLAPEEAYGVHSDELQHTVNKDSFGKNVDPKPGMVLGMNFERQGTQHKIPALVLDVKGEKVTLDFNHPLAGKTITYRLTLKGIK